MLKARTFLVAVALLVMFGPSVMSTDAATITLFGSGGNVPPSGTMGVFTDTIVSSDPRSITDVTLTLTNLTHTWVGDLIGTVTFASTTGTVFSRVGYTGTGFGDSSNFSGTYSFNDAFPGDLWVAATGGLDTFNIPGGNYFPSGAGSGSPVVFSSLWDGLPATGSWTLTISDNATGDMGSLGSWQLDIQVEDIEAIPEPATLTLLATGLATAMARRRRRGRA